ncbi:MAG TPA: hypothetical protein VJ770_27315 [Stellaceae bacterium]|nr:hypothetical protein [Stellaceae bacterium]
MTHGNAADIFEPLGFALLFAAIFAGAGRVKLPPALARREHALVSFFAGLSLSYVFVHLLPELETARVSLKLPGFLRLPPGPYLISVMALVGCILFFAVGWLSETVAAGRFRTRSRILLAIFALYVALVAYSRIALIEHGEGPALLFAIAMGTHFFALDHALSRDFGPAYDRRGRFLLAGASLCGWAVGATGAVGLPVMLLLFGFVAGAIIANSLIEELPHAPEARLGPFLAGSVLYALILLPFH